MKWGHSYEIDGRERLLYLVLSWVISQASPIDNWLKIILADGGGLGGDPGWEIDHISSEGESGTYRVWADSEMSGIEQEEEIYSANEVHHALQESLLALGKVQPEKANEIFEVLEHYRNIGKFTNS